MGGRTGWQAQRLRRRPCRAQMAPEEPESEETETADQKRRWRINFGHPKCWIIRCGRRTALKSLLRGQFSDFQWAIETYRRQERWRTSSTDRRARSGSAFTRVRAQMSALRATDARLGCGGGGMAATNLRCWSVESDSARRLSRAGQDSARKRMCGDGTGYSGGLRGSRTVEGSSRGLFKGVDEGRCCWMPA